MPEMKTEPKTEPAPPSPWEICPVDRMRTRCQEIWGMNRAELVGAVCEKMDLYCLFSGAAPMATLYGGFFLLFLQAIERFGCADIAGDMEEYHPVAPDYEGTVFVTVGCGPNSRSFGPFADALCRAILYQLAYEEIG